jgi:hypothetical protein
MNLSEFSEQQRAKHAIQQLESIDERNIDFSLKLNEISNALRIS